ncbi:streptomycin 6-kinase [Microlunatus panaciterrae]|uniref:Streptomycin 6-kinase n=1 Tax=Microlunatus panaciterrae TaxID=400768 RepID=A0ABS2RNN6_9ACTN|nr:aminoglycoside phosphotransferase family protein [Microlunatus panaciterrae]MBM7800610.1 streptomycin 6-kinase [Microlunatus panaciterrae]
MSDFEIPAAFAKNADNSPEWRQWLDQLPRLIRDVVDDWGLTAVGELGHGSAAVVLPVLTGAREPAVVKVGWPHEEAEHEHLALREWGGRGAVRLLRADPRRSVLLLERAQLRDLTTVPAIEACETVAALYPLLHRPAVPQLRTLSSLARRWSVELGSLGHDAPVPHRYVEQAISLATDFAADPDTDGLIVHTDLHYFNVLESARPGGGWLVIDPKPLSGDPHVEVAPLLWNRWDEIAASGNVRWAIRERFHTIVDAAGLDEDRARAWVIVRVVVNVLWSMAERANGRPAAAETAEWVTNNVTIAKAVQD